MDAPRQAPTPTPWAGPAIVGGVAVLALALGWSAGRLTRTLDAPGTVTAKRSTPVVAAPAPHALLTRPMQPPPPLLKPALPAVGVTEVCGFGLVQVPPDDPDPVQRIPLALRQSALDAVDAAMLASEDDQIRAAALWMGARIRGREVRARVEQMARLAAASQDPYVYAMALEACQGLRPAEGGSCELLSRAQWVRLDPDNAVPWQALAAEAHEHDDPVIESTALQLAARALRSDVHVGWLPRLVDKALGAQAAPLQRTLALSASWSAEAVWAASHGQAAAAQGQGYDLSCESVERMQSRVSGLQR